MQRSALSAVLVVAGCEVASSQGDSADASVASDAGNGPDGSDGGSAPGDSEVRYTESRVPCRDRSALRNAYYGDLHVHTAASFDAYVWSSRADAAAAYAFARGEELLLPPLDAQGDPTRSVQLARPLDFAAVTDHAEFLGELATCLDPDAAAYDTELCQAIRGSDQLATAVLGAQLFNPNPERVGSCTRDTCPPIARSVWERIRAQTEAAYDRSEECSFTTLHGYEWTGATEGRNLHRNVLFRNDVVPDGPVSYYDASTPEDLWKSLRAVCKKSEGCEVLAIPHNSNLSNGGMFSPPAPNDGSKEAQAARARTRAEMEPLVEIFQHKGNSECLPSVSGILGEPDELCTFEELRERVAAEDCGDDLGTNGLVNQGCVSRYDFVRGALLAGLSEERRLGVNPLRLGVIGSTDTHNAAAGATEETDYAGHVGSEESTPEERLTTGMAQPSGLIANPGGLAGVWAVENSRDALFEALARRETFGTSGTRIAPRFFGGYDLATDLCDQRDFVASADRDGVPMGGTLQPPGKEGAAPRFLAAAMKDPADFAAPLQRLQIIKGWLDASGALRYKVFEVAGDADAPASVDEETCERQGDGHASLCTVWTDPEFDVSEHAYYYLRVVENPSCRWSWRECLRIPSNERPESCSDPTIPRVIQELAWTSPIWFSPLD